MSKAMFQVQQGDMVKHKVTGEIRAVLSTDPGAAQLRVSEVRGSMSPWEEWEHYDPETPTEVVPVATETQPAPVEVIAPTAKSVKPAPIPDGAA